MKQYKISFLMLLFVSLFLQSCEKDKDSEGISKITKHVNFIMGGNPVEYRLVGSDWTHVACTAEGGETVTTSGDKLDLNTIGEYHFLYEGINKDGYKGSASQIIYVLPKGDNTKDISGFYDGSRGSKGGGPITITKVLPGVYEVSDLFAGYYDVVRKAGANYRAHAFIFHKLDGTWELAYPGTSVWGDVEAPNGITVGADGIISYNLLNDGFEFGGDIFTLTKQPE